MRHRLFFTLGRSLNSNTSPWLETLLAPSSSCQLIRSYRTTALHSIPIARLIELPNELLVQTASSLPTTDLLFMSQANRWLYSFVKDYLSRYRYNKGLTRLLENVLTEIITRLLPQTPYERYDDARNLARTSQRFLPLAMGLMIREDVQDVRRDLMGYAAARGLKAMVRRLLAIDADVNCCLRRSLCSSPRIPYDSWNYQLPLSRAAHYGQKAVVHLLLDAGAKSVDGLWLPG
jgi:hypothetical protein